MMMRTKTLITIHSGGLEAPANSRTYLRKALEKRPDIIEIDIRRTSDNQAILSHDAWPPGGGTLLARRTLAEVKAVYPEVLTLEEAIDLCHHHSICLNLDIKEYDAVMPAVEMVTKRETSGPFIFSGCGRDEVNALRAALPEGRVLYNARPWDHGEFADYSRYVLAMMGEAEELGCFGLNISSKDLKPELMGYSRLFDIPVFVWTVDEAETMRELVMMGVYSITTNNVDLLREVLSSVLSEKRRLEDVEWVNRRLF